MTVARIASMALTLTAVLGCQQILDIQEGRTRISGGGGSGGVAQGGSGQGGSGGAGQGGSGGAGQGGSGGAGQGGCWATDVQSWTITAAPVGGVTPQLFDELMLSADGLTLTWTGGAPLDVNQTTRSSTQVTFSGGSVLFPAATDSWRNPWLVNDQIFVNLDNFPHRLMVSTFDGSAWDQTPTILSEVVAEASNPTTTADGTRLIAVWEGASAAGKDELREIRRPDGIANTAFGPETVLTLPPSDVTHTFACPALSPDGLSLFFASTHPVTTPLIPAGAQRIWYAARVDLESPFVVTGPIAAFDNVDGGACPQSVSFDGCEFWYKHLSGSGGVEMFVAARFP